MENKACDSVELDNIDIEERWSPAVTEDVTNSYSYQNFSEKTKLAKKKEKPFAKKALKCLGLFAMFIIIVSLGIALVVKYGGKTSRSYGKPDHHHEKSHTTHKPHSTTTQPLLSSSNNDSQIDVTTPVLDTPVSTQASGNDQRK